MFLLSIFKRINELLKATDYYLLPGIGRVFFLDKWIINSYWLLFITRYRERWNKLNAIKIYRQELRDFTNKLLNEEIECNVFDDELENKCVPKLILDGRET